MSDLRSVFTVLLALTLGAETAQADNLSVQDLLDKIEAQKSAIDTGDTRGLKLETPETDAAAAAKASGITEPDTIPIAIFEEGIRIEYTIAFDFDSAALRNDQKPKLTNLCIALQQTDVATFRIIGHTDASGSEAYNARLSRLRAEEVARYLTGDCGIARQRLEAYGAGEQYLANPADPLADENRRVEFQVAG